MKKTDIFKKEINYVKNANRRKDVKTLIELLPDYFFEVPASSTGKYHPEFALGEGGLVRHTKLAVRIAIELLNNKASIKAKQQRFDTMAEQVNIHKAQLNQRLLSRKSEEADLDSVLSETHLDKIWNMLWARWCEYEKLCNL